MDVEAASGRGKQVDSEVLLYVSLSSKCWLTRSKVKVHTSPLYNKKKHDLDAEIDAVWEGRIEANPHLWNGTKFRLDSVKIDESSGASVVLTLNLGVTDYKEMLGTNRSHNAPILAEEGLKLHQNRQAFISDALGVNSLVFTRDGYYVLLRRSTQCGEDVGKWDTPGGHPEPEVLIGKISKESIDLESLDPEAVRDELFNSMLVEIRDEVGLPMESLSDPKLIGIDRNRDSLGRPTMEFVVETSCSRDELIGMYLKGVHSEKDETTDIVCLKVEEISNLPQQPIWQLLTPSCKSCFLFYINGDFVEGRVEVCES